jgi:hypothetical protein
MTYFRVGDYHILPYPRVSIGIYSSALSTCIRFENISSVVKILL